MDASTTRRLRPLIERLARLATAEDWSGDVNPTQMAALRRPDVKRFVRRDGARTGGCR